MIRHHYHRAIFFIQATVLFCCPGGVLATGRASDTLRLTLDEVVTMAREHSIDSRQASTQKENGYWIWRTYLSNYKPQLLLTGNLPGYSHTYQPVTQPNGNILFQPINYNYSSLNLSFEQSIGETGGKVYGTTMLQRFDDFYGKNAIYNGIPYAFGYSQPLFRFNPLYWDRKIEPLRYRESKASYIETMELIALNAQTLFFTLLGSEVDLETALADSANISAILSIANQKFDMGKVSKDEILKLQLESLNARKAVARARSNIEINTLSLKSYIGLQETQKIVLELPGSLDELDISPDKALSEAFANRSDATAFIRRVNEARRDVAKAVGDNGLNANLTAQVGVSNSSARLDGVYQGPKQQQQFQIDFVMPILDWGRSRSRVQTARANQQLVEFAVQQDKLTFTQKIYTQVALYSMYRDLLALTTQADTIAAEKYRIAKEQYLIGHSNITDLTIAGQEKDKARQDYIAALRDYWTTFYQIRYLSLYDFIKGEKINYP